jgi:hypothetical protein
VSVNGQGLYDLKPTEQELAELAEVLDEVEAEEGGYGPWDDSSELANVYDYSGAFAAVDAAGEAEAARQSEEVEDRQEHRTRDLPATRLGPRAGAVLRLWPGIR